jgi:hypothetical protein
MTEISVIFPTEAAQVVMEEEAGVSLIAKVKTGVSLWRRKPIVFRLKQDPAFGAPLAMCAGKT